MTLRTGVVTASSGLNVRPDASTQNPPVGKLSPGASVDILDQHGGWYRIRSSGLSGFVHGDFITLPETQSTPAFLCVDPHLCGTPLQPPAGGTMDPASATTAAQRGVLQTWNRYGGLLRPLSDAIGIPPAAATAVLVVESNGHGFLDGRMVIRFENHVFYDQWGKANPRTFARHFAFNPAKRWTGHTFRSEPASARRPFHGQQDGEWRVFQFARGLNASAAMRSISMGAPQIMGFNHAAIGYDSVGEMFERFTSDERFQILGMFDFIKGPGSTSPMIQSLQRLEFDQFAARYNGPGQAAVYGSRIRSNYEALRSLAPGLA